MRDLIERLELTEENWVVRDLKSHTSDAKSALSSLEELIGEFADQVKSVSKTGEGFPGGVNPHVHERALEKKAAKHLKEIQEARKAVQVAKQKVDSAELKLSNALRAGYEDHSGWTI